MQILDWILVAGSLILVVSIGVLTQQYMRSVADFMSAGRVARRYLLAVSKGEMQAGAVVFVATFELISHSGFTYTWWSWLGGPILLFVGITGFVVYRYRETRAMTLGQFFEIRYSKRFRVFTGFLGFIAGILNFGIIPAIGARAMVYFLGFPVELHVLGVAFPTYILLLGLFLTVNLFVVLGGGLITIIMTNCAEGIVSQILYLFIIFGLMSTFSWTEIHHTLSDRPPGQSFINPMDSLGIKDFNLWAVLMGIAGSIYGTMAWQNQSSYNSAPLTAHEAVMGGILGRWRGLGQTAVITLLAVCAMTYLHEPAYAAGASRVQAEVAKIPAAQIQEQMLIPIAVTHILPVGLRGAFCAILLLGIFGGDSIHLHSWGSLFIQDILLPFRKKAFTPEEHIRLLRLSIAGVAIFAFLFGIFFQQTDYIGMWFTVTMSLYIGGAGSAIIGGLYWKRGTTSGAWAGLLTGSVLSMGGIIAQQIYYHAFPLNGIQISFYAMLAAVSVYVIVSLLTCREDFNMDRMLHRGAYERIKAEVGDDARMPHGEKITWGKLIGYDDTFTIGDKWIAAGLFAWTMLFSLTMIFGTLWNFVQPWSPAVWSDFWHINAIVIPVAMSVITGVWFTWGGLVDTIDLFKRLKSQKINPLDSGFVVDNQNFDEVVAEKQQRPVNLKTDSEPRPLLRQ